jgi:predicted amidohydrolase
MKVTVAVAQYDVPDSMQASLDKLASIGHQAVGVGVQLLVVPETSIGLLTEAKNKAEYLLTGLQTIARECGLFLATSFYRPDQTDIVNQGYVVAADGSIALEHKKLYLASTELEDGVSPGYQLENVTTPLGKLGMLVCKDGFNRYSHFLYERLATLGTDITCVPAWSLGWPEMNTEEYIKAFYTYGAFLSRSFVLVSGTINRATNSFGRSLIVSPIRGVIEEGSRDREELLVQELDLDEVRQARIFDTSWQPKKRII